MLTATKETDTQIKSRYKKTAVKAVNFRQKEPLIKEAGIVGYTVYN
jgi:hypothetical protein